MADQYPPGDLNDIVKKQYNADKRIEIYDTRIKSLAIRITPRGTKSFVYRYRANGKNKRITIGKYPKVSVSNARKKASEYYRKIQDGGDPLAKRQAEKYKPKEMSFRELSDLFIKRHLSNRKETTRTEYKRILENELLGKWGNIPVSEITSQHVREILNKKAWDNGRFTMANRMRSVISKIFEFGKTAVGININQNPVKGTAIFKEGENVRKRFYTEDEIIELWNFFESRPEPICSLLKMLLICGQRKTETTNMKWSDIEYDKTCTKIVVGLDGKTKPEKFKADVWTITGNKSDRIHKIPLPPLAIDILEKLRPLTGNSEYVFESLRKEGQPVTLDSSAKLIKKETSIHDFRLHDLRRTVNTKMEESQIDQFITKKVLNHAIDSVTDKHYSWYDYMDKKQIALNRWGNRLENILSISGETKFGRIG